MDIVWTEPKAGEVRDPSIGRYADLEGVVERIGERRAREGAYAWRSLIDSGATIVNGTDSPVEPVDPIASFAASVTRRARDGSLVVVVVLSGRAARTGARASPSRRDARPTRQNLILPRIELSHDLAPGWEGHDSAVEPGEEAVEYRLPQIVSRDPHGREVKGGDHRAARLAERKVLDGTVSFEPVLISSGNGMGFGVKFRSKP